MFSVNSLARSRRRKRGVATVEFALALPLLLLFFAIAADYSRLFWCKQVIISCAYNGAIYASRADLADPDFDTEMKTVALLNAGELNNDIQIEMQAVKNPRGKNCVEVTSRYTFNPIMKLPYLPQDILVTHTVRMRQMVPEE